MDLPGRIPAGGLGRCRVIEVVFVCDRCGKRSEPIEADYIDTYTYHDAPRDGFTAWEPSFWKNDGVGGEVLCDEHSGYDPIKPLKVRGAGEKWKP